LPRLTLIMRVPPLSIQTWPRHQPICQNPLVFMNFSLASHIPLPTSEIPFPFLPHLHPCGGKLFLRSPPPLNFFAATCFPQRMSPTVAHPFPWSLPHPKTVAVQTLISVKQNSPPFSLLTFSGIERLPQRNPRASRVSEPAGVFKKCPFFCP